VFDIEISRALARVTFLHRVTDLPDGALAYRLADDSGHVRLSRTEWERAGHAFKHATGRVKRNAVIALFLWMPAYVLYIAICDAVVSDAWARALPRWLWFAIFVAPLFATPVLIFIWWTYRVIRIAMEVDASLTKGARVRISAPPRNPFRVPFWLDVLCVLFVGPHLIVATIGQFDPDALRNTPLTGQHIDGVAIFGFALIAVRLVWGYLARRWAYAPPASL